MLNIDLLLLDNDHRFQDLCWRLAAREFSCPLPLNVGSWDGGRDIRAFSENDGTEVVWQCKFVRRLDHNLRRSILKSLDALAEQPIRAPISKWILCIPLDPTEPFHTWLAQELGTRGLSLGLWSKRVLLEKLERHRDIVETFFYPVFSELRRYFQTDDLELIDFGVDPACQWNQGDPATLIYKRSDFVRSPDFVLDIVVRNTGSIDTAILKLQVILTDVYRKPKGLPGEGLLLPQITYRLSIHHGKPGTYDFKCEPPLIAKANGLARLKICLTETGFAWNGTLRVRLGFGKDNWLDLPAMHLFV